MAKVIVVGLDGATWDIIKPFIDEGELPTFKKLMDNGCWGELESSIPPWTLPAWETITTGKNSDKLGFASFMIKKDYKFVPYLYELKSNLHVWDYLSKKGYKVIVANPPNIYEGQPVNGLLISGWMFINRENSTYPRELIDEIDEVCNGYTFDIHDVDMEKGLVTDTSVKKGFFQKVYHDLEKKRILFNHLLKNYQYDFAFLVHVTTDRVQHKFWEKDKLLECYQKMDRELSNLLETEGKNSNIFLVSDHGFGEKVYNFNINEWFIKNGYLFLKNEKKTKRNKLFHILLRVKSITEKIGIYRHLMKLIESVGFLERFIKSKSILRFEEIDIDWEKTKAFGYGVWGAIYLNIKGRESQGFVEKDDYGKVCDEIIMKLKELKHPETHGILEIKIHKKEDIYENSDMNDYFPDIVIIPTDNGVQSISPYVGTDTIFMKMGGGGQHRQNGIFLGYGPDVNNDGEVKNLKIRDIAPTLLYMYDLPIPQDMDGRVLQEIFKFRKEPEYADMTYYFDKKAKIRKKIVQVKNAAKRKRYSER